MKKVFVVLGALIVMSLLMADSCNGQTPQQDSQAAAQAAAAARVAYIPTHNVEFNNYNSRQKIADDPTTILWCTGAFPIPASPLFTVPILGKLTSSGKRPFPDDPGPDGMYGSSSPYQYGFTPGGVYVEFSSSMSTFCTTEPTVWQRQNTTITVAPDNKLKDASAQCSTLLKAPTGQTPSAEAEAKCQALLAAAVGK